MTAKRNLNLNHPVSFSDLSIVETPFSREIERGLLFLTDTKKADCSALKTVSGLVMNAGIHNRHRTSSRS
jgi:hypothetical protein